MNAGRLSLVGLIALLLGAASLWWWTPADARREIPAGRREVVFWHFWGGEDRDVVDAVVDRFNRSQNEHFVRAVAMPGNNLDLKLFLAVTGGDPPDVINQDDPIVADWAERQALVPLDEIASPGEIEQLNEWLVPPARKLGTYEERLYALCNGLDVRALYYNKTLLDRYGIPPPRTLAELDELAERTTQVDDQGRYERLGYLPDPRRLWAWGIVFGGQFYDRRAATVTADSPPIVAALDWMTRYRERHGARAVAAFRQGDQSLPGKTFPLLADRYAVVMDGQWRVRDIAAAQRRQRRAGDPVTEYGVCALPPPPNGRSRAGWVNGNFFLVPRGSRNMQGAWEFMKFWTGFGGWEQEAAQTCVAGGWIPVSNQVAAQSLFQEYVAQEPLFAVFVQLAAEPNQVPTPLVPGARFFQRAINEAAAKAMYEKDAQTPQELLQDAARRVQAHLDGLMEVRRHAT